MVSIIAGKRGTGKTKRIIKMANESLQSANGDIIFIDDDKRHMLELNHDLRFLSMDEYPIATPEEFFGFLCGIASNNFDIEKIYVDGLFKIIKLEMDQIPNYVDRLKSVAETYDLDFVMTITCDETLLPEQLKSHLI